MTVTPESSQADIGAYLEAELAAYKDGSLPTAAAMENYQTLASRLPAIRSFELGPDYPKILLTLQGFIGRMRTVLVPALGVDAERRDAPKIVHGRDAA